jgi:hypothetical protein
MTVVARRIIATPARSASEAWNVIVNFLAPDNSTDAWKELQSIAGLASNLIADEAFADAPAVVYGSGPRVRIYCVYGEDALSGESASETALTFIPTNGDWRMSLPCPPEDLEWVTAALKEKSTRVTARNVNDDIEEPEQQEKARSAFQVDRGAFFTS